MDRTEAIDREVGLPVGWSFPMTRGYRLHLDVGLVFAEGLKPQRVGLPDRDLASRCAWADRT